MLSNTDLVTRLPMLMLLSDYLYLTKKLNFSFEGGEVVNFFLNHLSEAKITASQIRHWTSKDQILFCVHHFILHGWNTSNSGDLQPSFYC